MGRSCQVGCGGVQSRRTKVFTGVGWVARWVGHIILKRFGGKRALLLILEIKVEPI